MFQLEKLLPKTGDWVDMLAELPVAQGPLVPLAQQAATLFGTLAREFERITQPSANNTVQADGSTHQSTQMRKRRLVDNEAVQVRRPRPRAVSPEARQQRKDSNSPW